MTCTVCVANQQEGGHLLATFFPKFAFAAIRSGVVNARLRLTGGAAPLACRMSVESGEWIHRLPFEERFCAA